jgi:predicted membrane metal-binding protein
LVDQIFKIGYNHNMKLEINEILQWTGAVFIIAGHSLNAVGPAAYPYNILAFFLGTILFMAWSIRVANKPQLLVNIVALAIGLTGLVKAFG